MSGICGRAPRAVARCTRERRKGSDRIRLLQLPATWTRSDQDDVERSGMLTRTVRIRNILLGRPKVSTSQLCSHPLASRWRITLTASGTHTTTRRRVTTRSPSRAVTRLFVCAGCIDFDTLSRLESRGHSRSCITAWVWARLAQILPQAAFYKTGTDRRPDLRQTATPAIELFTQNPPPQRRPLTGCRPVSITRGAKYTIADSPRLLQD